MEDRIKALEERIAKLESVLLERQTQPLVTPLRVVNTQGQLLIEVVEEERSNFLRVYDAAGRVAIAIGAQDGGGFLTVFDEEGTKVTYLKVEMAGAHLELTDHEEKGGLVFYVDDEGGGINIANKTDLSLALVTDTEGGCLHVYEATSNNVVASLWATKAGGRLRLRDTKRRSRFSRPRRK